MTLTAIPFIAGQLDQDLCLALPPFSMEEPPAQDVPFRQLRYLEKYLASIDGGFTCRSVLVEDPYIDRDYMEDHSVFYSRSLRNYGNRCRRLLFFCLPADEIMPRLVELAKTARTVSVDTFARACRDFSEVNYLGFSVIKPLHGVPVGRTVLRCYAETVEDGRRRFQGSRDYRQHVLGLTLTVRGLAFQQQDHGVSACATTALWSSLQRHQVLEPVAAPTPAQITLLASQYVLPHGRSMPSDGLSLGQMCAAIQAVGAAPSLMKITDFDHGRAMVFAALQSGCAPVIVMEQDRVRHHAVTAVGVRLLKAEATVGADASTAVTALYVHDDRIGPYLRANLENDGGDLHLRLRILGEGTEAPWKATYLITPVHPKVRISLASLRSIALLLAGEAHGMLRAWAKTGALADAKTQEEPSYSYWIVKCEDYVSDLLRGESGCPIGAAMEFAKSAVLSRYVGVVRLTHGLFGTCDVLIDTTSTKRNLAFLGVIPLGPSNEYVDGLTANLQDRCQLTL